ncbi:MAG: signal peptidase I [Bacteroidota bacterium]
MKKESTKKEWIKAILFAFITIILFRVFFFEAFTIPSPSMEKSLLTGDYILVSKLSYGPRLPNTLLSFPFAHQRLPFTENTNSYLDWIKIPYKRLFGSPDIERNDVVVFNYPMEDERPVDQRVYYIKRCVAIAGDTLEIRSGQVYINDKYSDVPEQLQFNYKILADTDTIDSDTLTKLGITEGGKMHNKGEYWFTLNTENIDKIKQVPHVTSVEPLLEKKGSYSDYMFPENEHFLWNVDFFGPLYIPKSGDSVQLTMESIPLYERIIGVYEKNSLRFSNDSIFINDKHSTQYTFKMNYFFMMGDNRHSSADSRFWGFVPEDHIVGKTVLVLLSIDKSEEGSNIRWDRWFKAVK